MRDADSLAERHFGRRPAVANSTAVGLALWVVALLAGLVAQRLLTSGDDLAPGAVGYALAALLAALAVWLIGIRVRLPDSLASNDEGLPPRDSAGTGYTLSKHWKVSLVAISVCLVALSIYLADARHAYQLAFLSWVFALAILPLGVARSLPRRIALKIDQLDSADALDALALVGVLLLAVALRWPEVALIPPNVHGDEGAVGIEARRILYGETTNFFSVGWYGIPQLSFAFRAAFMALFGDSLYGLRMASVVQGTVTVLLLFLIARQMYGKRVALIASFLMAVSQWHIHFSRIGIDYMQALLAELLLFYFLLRATGRRDRVAYLLAGYSFGFCFDMYFAARLAPVLALIFLVHRAIVDRGFVRRERAGLAAMA